MPIPTHVLSRIAVAGIGCFAVSVAVAGLVTPDYDLRHEAISALAALDSPHAWVMILGFVAAAVGLVAAGLALPPAGPDQVNADRRLARGGGRSAHRRGRVRARGLLGPAGHLQGLR